MKASQLIAELWAAYRYEKTYDQRRRAGQAAELLERYLALADVFERAHLDGFDWVDGYVAGLHYAAKRMREIAEGREEV